MALINAARMTAWAEIYVSHPTHCPCSSCEAMDELLSELPTDVRVFGGGE